MSSIEPTVQDDLESVTIHPEISYGTHPIITGNYTIYTNSLCKVLDKLLFWISINAPGAVVYGLQRVGKTTTIKIIEKRLKDEYDGSIAVFSVISHIYSHTNDGAFFSDLIEDLGFVTKNNLRPNEKRRQIVQFLESSVKNLKQNRVILIVDEAQLLKNLHYELLRDIYNDLNKLNVCLTVILFGQMELAEIRAKFIKAKKTQIIGRFMCNEITLYGIQNVDDLRFCLEQLDNHKKYPKASNCNYTQYFFPEAYEKGYRLSNDTEDIFDVFYSVIKTIPGFNGDVNIPMLYFKITITLCLKATGFEGDKKYKPAKEDWELAVEEAKLRDFIY